MLDEGCGASSRCALSSTSPEALLLKSVLADTRPLRNPHFRRLWTANIVTVVGAQLTVVAVPAQIYAHHRLLGVRRADGRLRAGAARRLRAVGRRARRRDRPAHAADLHDDRADRAPARCSGCRPGPAPATCGCCSGCSRCSRRSSRSTSRPAAPYSPGCCRSNLLPAANSLNMTVMQAGAIGGPLIAGALIPVFGFPWLYLIDTITLIPTLGAVLLLPPLPIEGTTGSLGFGAVLDGLSYLRGHPVLLMSFLVDIIAMVFGMPRALFPEMAHVDFGGPDERRHRVRAAVRRHPDRRGARRRLLRLGLARRAAGRRRARLVIGLGARDDRLRRRGRARRPLAVADARPRRADAGDRRRRRHGLGRVPHEHAAERRLRRRTRPAPGRLHRRRRRRPADRRRRPRRGRGRRSVPPPPPPAAACSWSSRPCSPPSPSPPSSATASPPPPPGR